MSRFLKDRNNICIVLLLRLSSYRKILKSQLVKPVFLKIIILGYVWFFSHWEPLSLITYCLVVENFWRELSCDIKNKCPDRPTWVPVYKQNETKTQKPRSTFQSTVAMVIGICNWYIKASYWAWQVTFSKDSGLLCAEQDGSQTFPHWWVLFLLAEERYLCDFQYLEVTIWVRWSKIILVVTRMCFSSYGLKKGICVGDTNLCHSHFSNWLNLGKVLLSISAVSNHADIFQTYR